MHISWGLSGFGLHIYVVNSLQSCFKWLLSPLVSRHIPLCGHAKSTPKRLWLVPIGERAIDSKGMYSLSIIFFFKKQMEWLWSQRVHWGFYCCSYKAEQGKRGLLVIYRQTPALSWEQLDKHLSPQRSNFFILPECIIVSKAETLCCFCARAAKSVWKQ